MIRLHTVKDEHKIELCQGLSMILTEILADSPTYILFKTIYGREFRTMQEYDYWRNESVGRSVEELQELMLLEKDGPPERKNSASSLKNEKISLKRSSKWWKS